MSQNQISQTTLTYVKSSLVTILLTINILYSFAPTVQNVGTERIYNQETSIPLNLKVYKQLLGEFYLNYSGQKLKMYLCALASVTHLVRALKGSRFHPTSHPQVVVRFLVGAHSGINQSMFLTLMFLSLCLSFSLPLPLSKYQQQQQNFIIFLCSWKM